MYTSQSPIGGANADGRKKKSDRPWNETFRHYQLFPTLEPSRPSAQFSFSHPSILSLPPADQCRLRAWPHEPRTRLAGGTRQPEAAVEDAAGRCILSICQRMPAARTHTQTKPAYAAAALDPFTHPSINHHFHSSPLLLPSPFPFLTDTSRTRPVFPPFHILSPVPATWNSVFLVHCDPLALLPRANPLTPRS